MTEILNYIANARLNCVPQNGAFQANHFNTLHASVFPLNSPLAVQS